MQNNLGILQMKEWRHILWPPCTLCTCCWLTWKQNGAGRRLASK